MLIKCIAITIPFIFSAMTHATQNIEINLINPEKTSSILLTANTLKISLLNMPPKERDDYKISVGYNFVDVKKLTQPTFTKDQHGVVAHAQVDASGECQVTGTSGTLNPTLQKDIWDAATPEKIQEIYAEAKKTWIPSDNTKYTKSCLTYIKKSTTYTSPNIVVPTGYDVTAKVNYMGNTVASYNVVQTKKSDWMTHVGFTFTANRGESYYSEKALDSDTYTIQAQRNQSNTLYSATALFTYPVGYFGSDNFAWGWTAGLSASSDTIAVLIGPSIIIKKNVLINLGMIYQEFDELGGIYYEGQKLGSSPIDSSVLTTKSYKPSIALTVGFRFGE